MIEFMCKRGRDENDFSLGENAVHIDKADEELQKISFRFFYFFSRFEFALKENKYLKRYNPGETAEASWGKFVESFKDSYQISHYAQGLIDLRVKKQVVDKSGDIVWKVINLDGTQSDLEKVKIALNGLRNNLFHGGKHGDQEVDDVARNKDLLKTAVEVLIELAEFSGLDNDLRREY